MIFQGFQQVKYSRTISQRIVIRCYGIDIIDNMPQALDGFLRQVAEMGEGNAYTLQEPVYPTGS